MKELPDYIRELKRVMDLAQGEDFPVEVSEEGMNELAVDLKFEAKKEIEEVGVKLATDDIVLITKVYNALAVYLFRHDTNKIMDENEDTVERFISLLLASGVPEEDMPDILENIEVDDKFNTILSLRYKDDKPPLELSAYSKYLVSRVTNELQFIPPRKLVEGGYQKVFDLLEVDEMHPIEILYALSLFGIEGSEVHTVLAEYDVDLNAISAAQRNVVEDMKFREAEAKANEV